MKITILDDYFDTLRTLDCFKKLGRSRRSRSGTITFRRSARWPNGVAGDRGPGADPRADGKSARRSSNDWKSSGSSANAASIRTSMSTPARGAASSSRRTCTWKLPSYAAAELTWALVLAAMRQVPQQMAALKAGKWQIGVWLRTARQDAGHLRLRPDRRASSRGYGKAFGMNVLVWAREESRERARRDGYEVAASKEAFFAGCDVLSLHMRLVPGDARHSDGGGPCADETVGAAGEHQSRAADRARRPGRRAEGRFARAWRPLTSKKKSPSSNPHDPLLTLDNVVCTPHIGYVSRDEYEIQFSDIFDQIVAYAAGTPINVVNPEVFFSPRFMDLALFRPTKGYRLSKLPSLFSPFQADACHCRAHLRAGNRLPRRLSTLLMGHSSRSALPSGSG